MYVRETFSGPMPPVERHDRKPHRSFREKLEYHQDKFMNQKMTIAKTAVTAGGILGLGYAYKNPGEVLTLIQKHAPMLEKPATRVYKYMKSGVEMVSKHLDKLKGSNWGKKVVEECSTMKPQVLEEVSKAKGILNKIPGPAKAVALVAAGLCLVGGIRKSGEINQRYE